MTGFIKEQAGDAGKGKWDIATIPGERWQLGRLVPGGPEAEQEHEGRRSSWSSS